METVVDSKQDPLPGPTVIIMALENAPKSEYSNQVKLLAISKELTMESVDTVQIGNTVFLAHKGKKSNKNKMVGRMFNVDTARNMIANYVQYLKILQNKGVTHFSFDIDDDFYLPAVKSVTKRLEDSGIRVGVSKFKNKNGYRVYFRIFPSPEGV
tara:strand:+ start:153 stop:617 length:465 start_codon:yes stop_codon:yes gene_type:complete